MIEYVGQKLGNYRLVKLLGRGGFADVYLGEHIYLQTPAAIKVLQMRLTDEALGNSLPRQGLLRVSAIPISCPCWNSASRTLRHSW